MTVALVGNLEESSQSADGSFQIVCLAKLNTSFELQLQNHALHRFVRTGLVLQLRRRACNMDILIGEGVLDLSIGG